MEHEKKTIKALSSAVITLPVLMAFVRHSCYANYAYITNQSEKVLKGGKLK